jgi:hypothetical protein
VLCSGVRRILPALVKGLAHGSPLADASALVTGMTRTTCLVSPARCSSRNRAASLLRLAVNSARPSLVGQAMILREIGGELGLSDVDNLPPSRPAPGQPRIHPDDLPDRSL